MNSLKNFLSTGWGIVAAASFFLMSLVNFGVSVYFVFVFQNWIGKYRPAVIVWVIFSAILFSLALGCFMLVSFENVRPGVQNSRGGYLRVLTRRRRVSHSNNQDEDVELSDLPPPPRPFYLVPYRPRANLNGGEQPRAHEPTLRILSGEIPQGRSSAESTNLEHLGESNGRDTPILQRDSLIFGHDNRGHNDSGKNDDKNKNNEDHRSYSSDSGSDNANNATNPTMNRRPRFSNLRLHHGIDADATATVTATSTAASEPYSPLGGDSRGK